MKFSSALIFAGAAAAQFTNGTTTWTTEIVKSIVTYCPEPTQFVHNGKTIVVTKATTLTITDCPCTVTKPVVHTPVVECKTCNTTTKGSPPAVVVTPTGGVTKPSNPPVVAGAAKLSGAGLAAVLGAAILL